MPLSEPLLVSHPAVHVGLRTLRRAALLLVALCGIAASTLAAQKRPPSPLALGDQAYDRLDPATALRHYMELLETEPKNAEALWKASRAAVDLGEYQSDLAAQRSSYLRGQELAERAVAETPDDADANFALARALGRTALSLGTRDRIRYAERIRALATRALAADPDHAGALHVMGMWHAEISRLNGFSRAFARTFLGAKMFAEANWADAVRYLERAVAAEPTRIIHRLDLGLVYLDSGARERGRLQLEQVVALPATDFNDPHYKKAARARLEER